jgi:O-antigen ligase
LQWWLELGAVGALIGAAMLAAVATAVGRALPARADRAAALGLFVACLSPGSLSFGIWQGWWLSTLFFVAAVTAAVTKREQNKYI